MTVLLTGYSHLKGHLFKLGLTNSPICDRCEQASATASHINYDCVALATLRFRLCHCFLKPSDFEVISVSRTLHSTLFKVRGCWMQKLQGCRKGWKCLKCTGHCDVHHSEFCSILFYSTLGFFYNYEMTPWLFMVIVGICEMLATNVHAYRRLWR